MLLYFCLFHFVTCIIPSSLPDCSLESHNIEYIYDITYNNTTYLNQTWKVEIGERHFFKNYECISTKQYVLVSKHFIIDLLTFEIWLKKNVIGEELCGYMGIKLHDGSYFNFQTIFQDQTRDFENLKIDKKYDEVIKTFAIGTNFKSYIKKEGKLNKEDWLSLIQYLNIYYKDQKYNVNKTIYSFRKAKEHWFLGNIVKKYTSAWFSNFFNDYFGYEYYIYGEPGKLLSLTNQLINNIGNEILKKNNHTLNKTIGEYIIDENDKSKNVFQIYQKIIVHTISNGLKIKNCSLVNIKQVMNKINKCGEQLMVYTNYGIRFYNSYHQTLILPEDLENCDNKIYHKNLLKNDNIISQQSMLDLVKFQIINMDILTVISFITLIILIIILILITIGKKFYLSYKNRQYSYNTNLEEDVIIEDYQNQHKNIIKAILV